MLSIRNEVSQKIAEDDDMYCGNKDHYFGVGESALKNIIISLSLVNKEKCLSILDMPSGYGRVLRYLRYKYPEAKLTACDLDKKMVDFCVENFNASGVYSDKNLKNINLNEKFDLIWCGPLFTHLNKDKWYSFLEFFNDHLENNGVLIFTTHGRHVFNVMEHRSYDYGILEKEIPSILKDFNKRGFGYKNYPNNSDYGISIASFSWIYKEIEKLKDMKIVLFSEKGWDNHQDVIACVKENQNY